MSGFFLHVLTAVIGSIGFALIFSVDLRYVPHAALGGGICWAVYLLVFRFSDSLLAASITASFAATLFSELSARLNKTPATVFLLPSLIPLVPGGSLYYTMSSLLAEDYGACAKYALETAGVVLGVSGGVVAASLIVYSVRSVIKSRNVQLKNKIN